eukprot:7297-Prorocentrum_minimum.AAC.9
MMNVGTIKRARLGYLLQTLTKLFGCSMCALVVSVITRRGRVNTLLRHRSAPRVHHGGLGCYLGCYVQVIQNKMSTMPRRPAAAAPKGPDLSECVHHLNSNTHTPHLDPKS